MTALAMIIGMVPMALGLGDGAGVFPLAGRLLVVFAFATVSTLFFVPAFSVFYKVRAVIERSRIQAEPN